MSEPGREPSPCPKCGKGAAPGATSCSRCGLVFALWKPGAAEGTVRLDGRAESLWKEALADWGNQARHEAFLTHCVTAGLLGPAGRRYRSRLDAAPEDALARRMQERIIKMMTVQLGVARAVAPSPVTRSRWFWAVLVLFAVVGLVAGLLYARTSRGRVVGEVWDGDREKAGAGGALWTTTDGGGPERGPGGRQHRGGADVRRV